MNKLISLAVAALMLGACAVKKAGCDAYSVYQIEYGIPYNDSVIVTEWHEHVHFDNKPHCIYVPKEIIYYTDTVELVIPIERQYHEIKR
jgi:hypothetical protein